MVDFEKLDEVDGDIAAQYGTGDTVFQEWMLNTIWKLQEEMGILSFPTSKEKKSTIKWGDHTGFESPEKIKQLIDKYTKEPKGNGHYCIPAAIALKMTDQFIGIDIDNKDDIPAIVKSLNDNGINHKDLYIEATKRGAHIYLWLDRKLTKEETKLIDDIPSLVEFKHYGTLMMLAGSYHKSGDKCYKELNKTIYNVKDTIVSADNFLSAVKGLRKENDLNSTTWCIIKPNAPRKFKYTPKDIRDEFNKRNPIESMLQRNGYYEGTEKWIHPNGDSNPEVGSVDIIDCKLSYHWGQHDQLKGKGTGKDSSCFDSFGIYIELENHGDFKEAIKNASQEMGMNIYEDGKVVQFGINKNHDNAEFHDTTEEDVAKWFCSVKGDDLLYSEQERCWYIWDGKYWKKDKLNTFLMSQLSPFIHTTMKKYMLGLSDQKPNDERKKSPRETFSTFIKKISNYRPMSNIEKIAQSILGFDSTKFDITRNQLTFRNGVVDLHTGKLLPHSRSDHHTRIIDVDYNPNAKCPTWIASLHKITSDAEGNPRPMMPDYLQKCFGYSITGEILEQCLFILFGEGQNGKSFITEYIRKSIGGFGKIAQQEILLVGNNQKQNSFAESDLQGVRMAYVSETRKGEKFDTAKFKRLTNKTIVADRKYERPMEFQTTHKLFIDCNHKPVIKESDKGTWRRLRLIPFDYIIDDKEVDSRIDEKWDKEIEGILAWLVEGAKRWYAEGLGEPPAACINALETYKNESDPLNTFIEECLELSDDEKTFISNSDMYKIYTGWAKDNGHTYKYTKNNLKKALSEKGLCEKRQAQARGLSGAYITDEGSEYLHQDKKFGNSWE